MNVHPYVAAVVKKYQGQLVEIYLGDTKNTLKFAEYDHALKNVIKGKVIEGLGDALVLDVNGTEVLLNAWSIKATVPVKDHLFIKDIFHDEHEGFAKKLRQ